MAGDDRDLDQVVVEIDPPQAVGERQDGGHPFGNDLAGRDADRQGRGALPARGEIRRRHLARLDAVASDPRDGRPAGEQFVADDAACRNDPRHCAGFEIVEHDQVGAPARRDQAAVAQPEDPRRGNAGGAIGGERRRAERDRGADHVVEVALLGDVERIAVVGAEGDVGRIALGDDRRQRVQVLRHRALAHQDLHALGQLLQRLWQVGRLVVGAHARGEIAVEVEAPEQRRVAVDRPVLKERELQQTGGVAGEQSGEVHQFGEAERLRVGSEWQQLVDFEFCAGGLEVGGRHTARQLHSQVERRRQRGVEEILDAGRAEHVGDLVRIADRGGDAARQHAAVEFKRRDQRRLDVQVGVDEAWNDDLAGDVDLHRAAILGLGSHDAVVADGDVARLELAGYEIEDAPALEHEIGAEAAATLRDGPGEEGGDVVHRLVPPKRPAACRARVNNGSGA